MGQLKYKGYTGSVEYCGEDNTLYGKVLGMGRVGITYLGQTPDELKKDFEGAIDFYIETCREEGTEPVKPYSGKMNLRMPSELHESIARVASALGVSINDTIIKGMEEFVSKPQFAH